MFDLKKLNLSLAATVSLFITYSYFIISFVWNDGLSSFASDSANYMLMAQYMSPWQEPSAAVIALWPYQYFPPFFPLILAITGAAHNMLTAHILTTIFLLASLPLIYYFARQCFATHWQALGVTAIFSLAPSTWLNSLGILSENLYIFLSLIVILMFNRIRDYDYRLVSLFGILLATLILTRTIGVAMFISYLIVGYVHVHKKQLKTTNYLIPIVIVLIINLLAKFLNKSVLPASYIHELQLLEIAGQPKVLFETWFSAWQFYWVDDLITPRIFVFIIGVLACVGLVIRLRSFKLDAFYVLGYLGILLVWPHPGQSLRFIYPVHALLIVYAFFSIYIIFNHLTSTKTYKPVLLLLLVSFSIIGPTLSYLWNRYSTGKDLGYHHIHEFYRFPDLKHAKNTASTQVTMFNDMKIIESQTEEDDIILHFAPVYITLLANRFSKGISYNYSDDESIDVNNISEADYVYISKIHPRRTGKDINGLDLKIYFNGVTEPIWTHYSPENNEPVSVFLKIN
jgi:hypothetical protein